MYLKKDYSITRTLNITCEWYLVEFTTTTAAFVFQNFTKIWTYRPANPKRCCILCPDSYIIRRKAWCRLQRLKLSRRIAGQTGTHNVLGDHSESVLGVGAEVVHGEGGGPGLEDPINLHPGHIGSLLSLYYPHCDGRLTVIPGDKLEQYRRRLYVGHTKVNRCCGLFCKT